MWCQTQRGWTATLTRMRHRPRLEEWAQAPHRPLLMLVGHICGPPLCSSAMQVAIKRYYRTYNVLETSTSSAGTIGLVDFTYQVT